MHVAENLFSQKRQLDIMFGSRGQDLATLINLLFPDAEKLEVNATSTPLVLQPVLNVVAPLVEKCRGRLNVKFREVVLTDILFKARGAGINIVVTVLGRGEKTSLTIAYDCDATGKQCVAPLFPDLYTSTCRDLLDLLYKLENYFNMLRKCENICEALRRARVIAEALSFIEQQLHQLNNTVVTLYTPLINVKIEPMSRHKVATLPSTLDTVLLEVHNYDDDDRAVSNHVTRLSPIFNKLAESRVWGGVLFNREVQKVLTTPQIVVVYPHLGLSINITAQLSNVATILLFRPCSTCVGRSTGSSLVFETCSMHVAVLKEEELDMSELPHEVADVLRYVG